MCLRQLSMCRTMRGLGRAERGYPEGLAQRGGAFVNGDGWAPQSTQLAILIACALIVCTFCGINLLQEVWRLLNMGEVNLTAFLATALVRNQSRGCDL